MHTATEMAAPAEDTRAAWITLAEAGRITGLHNTTVLRMALAGSIAWRGLPGARKRYRRADCERIAAAARASD